MLILFLIFISYSKPKYLKIKLFIETIKYINKPKVILMLVMNKTQSKVVMVPTRTPLICSETNLAKIIDRIKIKTSNNFELVN
ncbi:MAG: hypothetical protein EF813_04880 [Methanosarcinales archaeon]|nr:MAG: hypothetical protein EF813_04880 [Methanosarcinales archaeon]